MADSTGARTASFPRPTWRGAVAVGVVAVMALVSHLLVPRISPAYATPAQYATYLVAFSVWMAWFVDWLAVWLGQEAHPSERDGES